MRNLRDGVVNPETNMPAPMMLLTLMWIYLKRWWDGRDEYTPVQNILMEVYIFLGLFLIFVFAAIVKNVFVYIIATGLSIIKEL